MSASRPSALFRGDDVGEAPASLAIYPLRGLPEIEPGAALPCPPQHERAGVRFTCWLPLEEQAASSALLQDAPLQDVPSGESFSSLPLGDASR